MNDFPIITKLGGRNAVYAYLQASGVIKTRRAMSYWRTRGRIANRPLHALMALAEAQGIAYSLSDFDLPTSDGSLSSSAEEPCVT